MICLFSFLVMYIRRLVSQTSIFETHNWYFRLDRSPQNIALQSTHFFSHKNCRFCGVLGVDIFLVFFNFSKCLQALLEIE